jgi:peptidoglycan/xylan/chitin deacetylase (PgdA/CDA1 family)
MILAFLYHRVGDGKYANSPAMMEKQLSWIADHFPVVLPGEPVKRFRLNVCLTFDDATYDFYHYVFPLLKRLKLRALLAVPTHFIQSSTALDPQVRLAVPYSMAMKGDTYRVHCPFCTWEELNEMVQSGFVEIASHSVHHQHLLTPGLDLDLEIRGSKQILEDHLHVPIRTFVYPLGKFNRPIHQQVKKNYKFAMRIGTSWNTSWQNISGIIYRVISDNMVSFDQHFCTHNKISYLWFYILNTLRGR